ADSSLGACLLGALEASGGLEVWQTGTLWKCPGCGDRTVRVEEFLEGLRRAEAYLQRAEEWRKLAGEAVVPARNAALTWMQEVAAKMFGCERDRVYIKDVDGPCSFAGETYISRI